MSFFSGLIAPYRKGETNFERGRAAELRGDFAHALDFFQYGADAFDAHFAMSQRRGKDIRPSHLVMAGICYTKIGRNEDGLRVLEQCIRLKEIPDAFLHAGYAAAKLGLAEKAIACWSGYPAWAEQPILAQTLKELVTTLRAQENDQPALQAACETVAKAVLRQDKANAKTNPMRRGNRLSRTRRGY